MCDAEYTSTLVTCSAGAYEMNVKGRIVRFDGYTRVLVPVSRKTDDAVLPDLAEGQTLTLLKLDPAQHFTKPSSRYGEASLVREMEKRGIGRPSTYASIISTIQDRGYVRLDNKRFYAEKMGDIVTQRLQASFTELLDYGFTASMEERLDEVAQGKLAWHDLLDNFYAEFSGLLEKAGEAEPVGMQLNEPTMTDIECGTCNRPMQVRTASTGVFLGCSGYALPPKERCKNTLNLTSGDEAIMEDADDEAESRLLRAKHRCVLCNTAMDSYLIDEGRKLHVCGNNPDCSGFEVEEGKFKIKGYEGLTLDCDKCDAQMQLKNGRFGKYFGCTALRTCKNTRKLVAQWGGGTAQDGSRADAGVGFVKRWKTTISLRDGAAGLFLAASQFPRNRETRAPLVTELLAHQSEDRSLSTRFCSARRNRR